MFTVLIEFETSGPENVKIIVNETTPPSVHAAYCSSSQSQEMKKNKIKRGKKVENKTCMFK